MRFESWSKTERGLVRETNQDAVGCFPDLGLFVVADGMGGHADGDVASRLAVEAMYELYADSRPTPGRLEEAVALANRVIFAAGRAHGRASSRPMGTTIVALDLSLDDRRARWAHLGDSRLYRVRQRTVELMTADHTDFGDRYRGARSIPLDVPHTNMLNAALGLEAEIDLTSGGDDLLTGDLYLLCSDGISGLVSPQTLRMRVSAARSLAESGETLIQLALDAGGTDNASLVLVRAVDG